MQTEAKVSLENTEQPVEYPNQDEINKIVDLLEAEAEKEEVLTRRG